MKIIKVIPFQKNIGKEELTYFSSKDIRNGSIVNIPFRNKKILGLVTSSLDASTAKGAIKGLRFNLKKVIDVKENTLFSEEFIDSVFLTNKYFAQNKNDGFTSLIPVILRDKYNKIVEFAKKKKLEKIIL